MDVVGPISPPSSKGHRFILTITDYFSKWTEAIPLREVKTSDVMKFIKHHVVYRFGVPRRIVHDNGSQFISQAFQRFCNKFRIQSLSSTAYYPAANSLAEAFNKTKGKFQSKWEGPFVVESVYLNRAYRLVTPDDNMLMMPINGRFLKKYYS